MKTEQGIIMNEPIYLTLHKKKIISGINQPIEYDVQIEGCINDFSNDYFPSNQILIHNPLTGKIIFRHDKTIHGVLYKVGELTEMISDNIDE